jgi:pimeloyl-ACP methyl ester carboxylesterase
MPVLLLAGEHDPKFQAIGARMAELIGPNASRVDVPGAGHAAHLEQPARTAALLGAFLARS